MAFVVALGVPTLAGLAGGIAAARYRNRRHAGTTRGSNVVVGLLLVGLGVVLLLPAPTGHRWLSVAGGIAGALVTLLVAGRRPGTGCGSHAELTLGAVSAHRLFEGVVLGTLYGAGAAVGLLGAVVLAGHTALETAAIGGLYATAPHRTMTVGAIALVQAGYVVGAVAGLGVAGAIPASVRTLVFAVVGGALLAVGTGETKRSIAAGDPTASG